VHEARDRLFGYSSVSATIREFVALGDRRFEADGSYLAGPFAPMPHLRVEYLMRFGNTEGSIVEVCDGQILRTMRTIRRLDLPADASEEQKTPEIVITRRDLQEILEAVQEHGTTPEAILQAELGIGGLPALLTALENTMRFESVMPETLGDRPCRVVRARWKPEFLVELETQFRYFGRDLKPYLPDHARIHFDEETLFPVRITYWPTPGPSGSSGTPLLTLEFTDIRLNEPISQTAFVLETPAGLDERDVTEDFVRAIEEAGTSGAPATP
jgi:hypothetical protein